MPLVQVTCEYYFSRGACVPKRVHTVVVSVQHSDKITLADLRADVMEKVVKAVIPDKYLDERTVYHINPCGQFVLGGPQVGLFTPVGHVRFASAMAYRCGAARRGASRRGLRAPRASTRRVRRTLPRSPFSLERRPRSSALFLLDVNSVLFGRFSVRRRLDRPQNHRRHVRRLGSARRRRVQRQRFYQGGPIGGVRGTMGGQVFSQSKSV